MAALKSVESILKIVVNLDIYEIENLTPYKLFNFLKINKEFFVFLCLSSSFLGYKEAIVTVLAISIL